MNTPRSGATSFVLALLCVVGVTSMSVAKTFVYVSNAQDGNIDAFVMDMSTGALTPIGKAEAAKLVMPMAVSPSKKHLYRRRTLSACPRFDIRNRSRDRRSYAESISAASGQHAPMSRPTRPDAFFSRPPMVATKLR